MSRVIDRVRQAFPRRFGSDVLALTLLSWLGLVLTALLIEVAVSIWGSIDESLWSHFSQLAAWYVLGMAGYITYVLLPMHVANGLTRREFAIQVALFLPVFALVSAALMTAGYGVERLFYALNDWPQAVSGSHLYSSSTDYGWIFVEFALIYLVWGAVGAVGGAAWYRSIKAGVAVTAAGILLITIATAALASDWGPLEPFTDSIGVGESRLSFAWVAPICLATFGATLALLWVVIRDIPIRSRTA